MSILDNISKLLGSTTTTGTALAELNRGNRGNVKQGTANLIAFYKASPWLRATVAKISFKVATATMQIFAVTKRGQARESMAFGDLFREEHSDLEFVRHIPLQTSRGDTRERLVKQLKQGGRLIEIEDHPILDLLNAPNPCFSGVQTRKLTQTYMDLPGEAFWVLELDGRGVPIEAWPIPPNWVRGVPTPEDEFYQVQPQPSGSRHQSLQIPSDQMIWFRDLDPTNPYGRGSGPGTSLGDTIETSEYADKFLKRFFLNNAEPSLIVAMENVKNQTDIDRAQREWDQRFRGVRNAFRTMFHSGKMKVVKLQSDLGGTGIIEVSKSQRDKFVQVYGVPPELIGLLENSNRATIRESRGIMATEVVIPRLDMFTDTIQQQLIPMFDDRLVFGFLSPVPEDEDFQLKAMKSAAHVPTENEWRKIQGLDSRGPAGDRQFLPTNIEPEEAPPAPPGLRMISGK